MVAEYTRKFYNPAAARWHHLTSEDTETVKSLMSWKQNVKQAWSDLAIENVELQVARAGELSKMNLEQPQLEVGSQVRVEAAIRLGRLKPADIAVEIYHGVVDSAGNIEGGEVTRMQYQGNGEVAELYAFAGEIPCRTSGRQGFALRILPTHADLVEPYEPGLILWENNKQS
jgi:starch phosphorylase